MLNIQLALLDRLSAFESAATQHPVGMGDYRSKAYYAIFMGPLHKDMAALSSAALRVTASAAKILQTGKRGASPELSGQLAELESLRWEPFPLPVDGRDGHHQQPSSLSPPPPPGGGGGWGLTEKTTLLFLLPPTGMVHLQC